METDSERTPLLDASSKRFRPSTVNLVWILFGIWTPVFLGALDATVVATLLSPIGSFFNKANQSSYLGISYLLSVAACTPLYGRLSDILGRKGSDLLKSWYSPFTIFHICRRDAFGVVPLQSVISCVSVFSWFTFFFAKLPALCCVVLLPAWSFLLLLGR